MGSEKLIVNELLAFLQHQLDVMDEVSLMQICTSSYTEDEIRSAKTTLYTSLDLADRMPSRRRDEKGERSLQDMFRVFKETDPDDVPTFVAKELRKLPPVTFDHVDVTRLLKDIVTLKASLAEMKFKLDASQNTISELRADMVALRNTVAVCRSPEFASKVNTRRGANNASLSSFESAKLDLSPAAVTANDALPRPADTASTPVEAPSQVSTATPRRAYSAAAAQPPIRKMEQQQKKVFAKSAKSMEGASRNRNGAAPGIMDPAPKKGQADKEGFVTVESKRRKPTCRNRCGTALAGPNMLLRPATPSTQLYVSRLHHSTVAQDIVEYIRSKTKWTLRVEKLESRHNINFKSFVVRVPTQYLETFMKEEFWPKGVAYRRFRGRLRDTTQRNTTPTQSSLRAQ